MTRTTQDTLNSLRRNVESDGFTAGFMTVYLDNARLPGQPASEFRAHLAALAKQGVYKVIDRDAFGEVKMT